MYKFPFNKKATIHILNVTSIYPEKDNAYNVEVQKTGNTYNVAFAPKAEVDLGLKLQEFLTQKQLDEVYPLLQALYDQGYTEASNVAAEEAAGADY